MRLSSDVFVLLFFAFFSTVKQSNSQINLYASSETPIRFLQKCFCESNEALVNDKCVQRDTTYNLLINSVYRTTKTLRSSKVDNVTISDIHCPTGHFNLTFSGDGFAFLENGPLLLIPSDIIVDIPNYCIEYYDDNGELYSEVKVCLKIPKVQLCCNASDGVCLTTTTEDTKVPIWVATGVRGIPVDFIETSVNCRGSSNSEIAPVNFDHLYGTSLEYTQEGPILVHRAWQNTETEQFGPSEYCLMKDLEGDTYVAEFCYKNPYHKYNETCHDSVCISKCCDHDLIFNLDEPMCSPGLDAELWHPIFYDSMTYEETNQKYNTSIHNMIYGLPTCGNGSYILDPEDITKTTIKILDDGNLYEEEGDTLWDPMHYCIDNFKQDNKIVEKALVCFKEVSQPVKKCEETVGIIYPVLLIFSSICLAITLAVYIFVPDLSAKIQGKCLISSIVALLMAYIFLTTVLIASDQLTLTPCSIIALIMQFFFLASFFWLNVMSFDIWRTFRCLKISKESPMSSRRRFILYSFYAWGCPTIIVSVTAVMQFLPDGVDNEELVRPEFSSTSCFFTENDSRASWAYFHGFITIILVVNSFFFLHLAWILVRAQKVSENALGSRNQQHKEWAKLYLKLFIIMGVTWIFEVVAYVEGSCSLWIVTDIINTLRGVFIFIIFVCKQDTMRKIRSRGTPALSVMRSTLNNTSSTFFSRNSKRTSSLYTESNAQRPTEELQFIPDKPANGTELS